MYQFKDILGIYNPWWVDLETAFRALPAFRRSSFDDIHQSILRLPQMISVTGPRRVGKSTILKQVIKDLISSGVDPKDICYYSFDDPALFSGRLNKEEFINSLFNSKGRLRYLFLDEIQNLESWELYLKKYYDLGFPLKIVVSGSATSPIFKKSRESLLGRLKDYHLLPFSFYEFALFKSQDKPEVFKSLQSSREHGRALFTHTDSINPVWQGGLMYDELNGLLFSYMMNGGFPEAWDLPSMQARQDYLYDNQIKKVIFEDLVIAADFRKPENLKRFFISLLENPGKEISLSTFATETEINLQQIQKYLPLLEMTDLVYSLPKFRAQVLRIRKGLAKYYISDLALRNAVMRITSLTPEDPNTLGLYAENLVYLALRRQRDILQVDYYREKDVEVDFILHTPPGEYIPLEVKYRNRIEKKYLKGLEHFASKHKNVGRPVVITKNEEDAGEMFNALAIPLPYFLIYTG